MLAAPDRYASTAAQYDVPFAALDDGLLKLRDQPAFRRAVGGGMRPVAAARAVVATGRETMRAATRMLHDVAVAGEEGADVVVHHPGLHYAPHVAEKLGVPAVMAPLQPGWVPTADFRALCGGPRLPRCFNRASYRVLYQLASLPRGPIRRWRRDVLGLPRRSGAYNPMAGPDGTPTTVLQAYSAHIFESTSDAPPSVHTTGFWNLPEPPRWTPARELAAFLAAGPPPVYIGFGSMVGADPSGTGRLVLDAVRRAGVRAVISAGWGGLAQISSSADVFPLNDVPHAWLFPRVAAVVHHSGGGTAGAALAAGRPQVLCPHLADQPLWANRLHRLGVAPPPLPHRTLTSDALAAAIRTAPALAGQAASLAGEVRSEEGTAAAIRLLEAHDTISVRR